MKDLLYRILGVDPSAIPADAQAYFTFTHPFTSWKVFALLALMALAVYGTFWLYRRETSSESSQRWRTALASLRCAVLLLLMVVWLGPALAYRTYRNIEPYVIVLVDDSMSMAVRDHLTEPDKIEAIAAMMQTTGADLLADAPSRADLVNTLLTQDAGRALTDLSSRGKVRLLTFSSGDPVLRTTVQHQPDTSDNPADETQPAPVITPIEPTGRGTNLARATRLAVRELAGNPIAAVVLITDGQHNEGDDPLSAAEYAGSMGIPIIAIGVGEPAEPRNIKVAELWATDSVYQDDPFVIESQLTADGFDGQSVRVELTRQPITEAGTPGTEQVIDSSTVTFAGAHTEQRVRFEHRPTESGDYIFAVRVPAQTAEVTEDDNRRAQPVSVLSDKARVLLIAGAPTWEYRMVSTLLQRDKTIDLSCWLQSIDNDMRQPGNTVIEQLPSSPSELFEYDMVLFIDPDPREFNQAWVDALRDFLGEHGGGMMWIAGPKHTARFITAPTTRGVRELLPITVGQLSALDVESLVVTHPREWPLRVTADGADHVMMRLDKDPQLNQQMWDTMPGIFWSFPVRNVKPGAKVLAEHSDPRLTTRDGARPLLVTGQFGPGRTVYMGFSGTWRWRKLGERFFDQYWVQSVRYLVEGRLLGEKKRGRVTTDRDTYPVGSRVQVSARLYDADFSPLSVDAMDAAIRSDATDPVTFELRPVPGQPGDYEGTVIATSLGLNEINLTLPTGNGAPVRIGKQFTVEVPRMEFADTRLNRNTLIELAHRTPDGAYLDIHQVRSLAAIVPDRHEVLVIKGKPIELWDNWRTIVLFLVLLTLEWALRKRQKMM